MLLIWLNLGFYVLLGPNEGFTELSAEMLWRHRFLCLGHSFWDKVTKQPLYRAGERAMIGPNASLKI